MKTKILWFVIGFALSWLTWSTIYCIRSKPKDITEHWPEEIREKVSDSTISWWKTAQGKKAGQFAIWTPDNSSIAEAIIIPIEGRVPVILISDSDTNGVLDVVSVTDSKFHYTTVNDKDGDGVFDTYGFSTGIHSNSILLSDHNLDGIFDTRLGPGFDLYININTNWYKLIHQDGKKHVGIDGKLKRVEPIDGVWGFTDK